MSRDITPSLDRGTILLKEGFGEVVHEPLTHQRAVIETAGGTTWSIPNVVRIFAGINLLSVTWRDGRNGQLCTQRLSRVISWRLSSDV